MLASLLAAGGFVSPHVDYHALAPEFVLGGGICLVLLVDLFVSDSKRWMVATLSGFVLLGAFLPVVTLGVIGADVRAMFDDRYVIDNFSLVLKALVPRHRLRRRVVVDERDRRGWDTTRASTT